jgi:hypothetical protein
MYDGPRASHIIDKMSVASVNPVQTASERLTRLRRGLCLIFGAPHTPIHGISGQSQSPNVGVGVVYVLTSLLKPRSYNLHHTIN